MKYVMTIMMKIMMNKTSFSIFINIVIVIVIYILFNFQWINLWINLKYFLNCLIYNVFGFPWLWKILPQFVIYFWNKRGRNSNNPYNWRLENNRYCYTILSFVPFWIGWHGKYVGRKMYAHVKYPMVVEFCFVCFVINKKQMIIIYKICINNSCIVITSTIRIINKKIIIKQFYIAKVL